MNLSKPLEVTCPECGYRETSLVWYRVNVTEDPTLKDEIMDGTINVHECSKCGKAYSLEVPFLYLDMSKRLMVWLPGIDAETDVPPYRPEILLGGPEASKGYRLRIVYSYDHLVEKILIFDDGLDDRAVEVAKAAAWAQYLPNTDPSTVQMFYDRAPKRKSKMAPIGMRLLLLHDEDGSVTVITTSPELVRECQSVVDLWDAYMGGPGDDWEHVGITKGAEMLAWACVEHGDEVFGPEPSE